MNLDVAAIQSSVPLEELGTRPVLVMLHGYEADVDQVFGIADRLHGDFDKIALRAPVPIADGFCWLPITKPGHPDPELLDQACQAVFDWLDAALKFDQPIGLFGFSQGGTMVTHLLRHQPHRFACAVNLAGFNYDGELPNDGELARTQVPVFFGRGGRDERILPEAFEWTDEFLSEHTNVATHVYPRLAHSMSATEIRDVGVFLHAHLK